MDNDDIVICISEFLTIPDAVQVGYTCRRLTRLCVEHILDAKFAGWEKSCNSELLPYIDLCDARMAQVEAEKEHRVATDGVLTALRAEIATLQEGNDAQQHQQRKNQLLELMEGQNRSIALWDAQCEAWLEIRTAMEQKFAEKKQTSDMVMTFVTFALSMSS
mmetsp:Transcript_21625/g.31976  ORF Transcript_21625/g.31976 Transcript_21625/m.31976 type:complete len:162 (+) Transcript_21625:106-591(+)